MSRPIAYTEFADGIMRPVCLAPDGRQHVHDPDGEPVYGVWYIPRSEHGPDCPIIVDGEF